MVAAKLFGHLPIQEASNRDLAEGRMMTGEDWLTAVAGAVRDRLPEVEVSHADDDTLTLALGTRGVVLHATRSVVLLAPSFASGGTIASRLESRVQHLDPVPYDIREETVEPVAHAVVGHLRP